MSDLPSLPVAQFVSSVDYWLNATWPMTEAEVCDLAAGAGWTLEDDGYVYVRNSALPFQEVLGISKRDKEATAFSFSLTADVPDHDAEAHEQLKDAFSAFVAAAKERWGKPSLSRRGTPTAKWDLGARGGLLVHYDTAVVATFVTPGDIEARKVTNEW